MRQYIPFLVMFSLAGCDLSTEPETRDKAIDFELRAQWAAAVTGVGSTVAGTASIQEYVGSHFDVEATVTGALPGRAYQWRIFRGSCAATAAADLALFSTIQAYPDIATDVTGAGSVKRLLAGALDSTQAYSLRMRLATSQTNWNGTSPVACGDLQRS